MSQSSWITRQHYSTTPDTGFKLLWPLLAWASFDYRLAIQLRNWAYNTQLISTLRCAHTPVISIGNLTTGGTGKTPVLKALAHALTTQHQLKVVILTRGYGATEPLNYGIPTKAAHGDEAYWLQQQLPQSTVIVGSKRGPNALKAEHDYQPDVILLDDGFQHRKLHRDMDLVLIDAIRGLGNGHCLPLGPLREPLSGLQRATHIAYTKGDLALEKNDFLRAPLKNKPIISVPFFPTDGQNGIDESLPLEALPKEAQWVLVSGIAHPSDFEAQITQWFNKHGGQVITHHTQSDHATYCATTVAQWEAEAQQNNHHLLTTEKDWDKIKPHVRHPQRWYRWRIHADVSAVTPLVLEAIQTYRNRQASGIHRHSKKSRGR